MLHLPDSVGTLLGTAAGAAGQRARRRFLGLTWGLAWGIGASSGARAQTGDQLATANEVFSQRLETTCRYQEALTPWGAAGTSCYLQVGQRRFLLAARQPLGRDSQRVREEYRLLARPHDTVSVSKARYVLSKLSHLADQRLSLGLFHAYPDEMTVEAERVLVRAEFSPLALLSLHPGPARAGQRVWVQNAAPDFGSDTLACYELESASAPGVYHMVLRERRTRGNRHWRHNNRITCEWYIDPPARQVRAVQWLGDNPRGAQHWERTYTSATDFVETCTGEVRVPRPVLVESGTYTLYTRTFTQVDARQGRDTYTIRGRYATEPALICTLITYYD
jgi:hypothetical protein